MTYLFATSIFESQCYQYSLDPSLSILPRTEGDRGGLSADLLEVIQGTLCDHLVLKALHDKVIQETDIRRLGNSDVLTSDSFMKYFAFFSKHCEPQLAKTANNLFRALTETLETPQAVPDFCDRQSQWRFV